MMATAVSKFTDIEDYYDQLVQWSEEMGKPVSHLITDEVLDAVSAPVARELMRMGSIYGATNVMSSKRRGRRVAMNDADVADNGGEGQRLDGRNPRVMRDALERFFQAADGSMKPLLDFTMEDIRHLHSVCSARAQGYLARAEWCEQAEEMLAESKKKKIREMPKKKLDTLAKKTDEVWR